jgi:quercetin dioxygenase-like cupin family protein
MSDSKPQPPVRPEGSLLALVVQSDQKPWKTFPDVPGVEYRVLRKHPENGGLSLMLRFAKGTTYPAHEHPGGEEYYMLDGDLKDGGKSYGRSAYVWHPPGSIHAPRSAGGAEILVFLPKAIRLV